MKKLLFSLILVLATFVSAKADPMFPYFVDLIGSNEYVSHTTFLDGYPERACDHYAPVSNWYQGKEKRVFSFLDDVLPSRILETKKVEKLENCTTYTFHDSMLDNHICFLIIAVYKDGTIGAEYIEAIDDSKE